MKWAGERVDTGEPVMCMGAKGLALEQAAVLPLALLTMHDAIVGNGAA